MKTLEDILSSNDDTLHKSVVKYYNHFKYILTDEPIDEIFIQNTFYPNALIFTNKRLLLCVQKNLGATIELSFEMPLVEIIKYGINEGVITDDFFVTIGNSSVYFNFTDFSKKTSFHIRNQFERITKINKPIWDKLLQEYRY